MKAPLHLFEGFGVELEYMIVDAESLSVLPIADKLLRHEAGQFVSDVEQGPITWSNELALHVIELKTTGPAGQLGGLADLFQQNVRHINQILGQLGGRLMPSGMHPWMEPDREMRLWPHEYSPVYEAFNRIFDCRGHGWANLQSVHLNLPFANDDEFGRLHAAIRLLLPIMPALAASSPFFEGRPGEALDNRMEFYRNNSRRIPSVNGGVIPEPVFTIAAYHEHILQRMYGDIAPWDPDGVLQDEFLNARGTIARFSRNALEVRVLDVAECPRVDLAICALIVEVLRALVDERWCGVVAQQEWAAEPLRQILLDTIRDGERAVITNNAYLEIFDYPTTSGATPSQAVTVADLWKHLCRKVGPASLEQDPGWSEPLEVLREQGPLARRLLNAVGHSSTSGPPSSGPPSMERLVGVYGNLCRCLERGAMFVPGRTME